MYETAAPSDLRIDLQTEQYLNSAAKWGRFLAIIGFIMTALLAVFALFAGSIFSSISTQTSSAMPGIAAIGGTFITVIYLVIAVIYFFPCLYLYQFGARMIKALQSRDQVSLNSSFQQLQSCFKFVGILMIIVLCFYALAILMLVAGGMTALTH
jgi:hypothetical protein